jgi:hypothetical protein
MARLSVLDESELLTEYVIREETFVARSVSLVIWLLLRLRQMIRSMGSPLASPLRRRQIVQQRWD